MAKSKISTSKTSTGKAGAVSKRPTGAARPTAKSRAVPKSTKVGSAKPDLKQVGVKTTKLDAIASALQSPTGATIATLMTLTGWQAHSVRGAIAGTLKVKRRLQIESFVKDGARFYRIGADQ